MDLNKRQQIQRDCFEKEAKDYNATRTNHCHYKKIELIAGYLNIQPGETVLEVGVGTGVHAKRLLEKYAPPDIYFIGCDLSPAMVEETRKKLKSFPNVRLFSAPGESLPLENSSVDKAYISGSLHHFDNKRKGLEELVRVVKSGGLIVISEPNIFNPINFVLTLLKFKTERGQFQTRSHALQRLFSGLPVRIIDQKLFNFTPPFLKAASQIFDKIDSLMENVPVLRIIGSMNIIVVKRL